MARKPRIHFPGALYHVITRGNRRQGIFLDERDHKRFLTYLLECKTRFPFRLYAYALMGNHIHLLIEVDETPLSRIMQSLLFAYTLLSPVKDEPTLHRIHRNADPLIGF